MGRTRARVADSDGMDALMDKLRAFQDEYPGIPGPICKACHLPEKWKKFMVEAKVKRGATCKQIAAFITAEGHPIRHGSVERHLRGDCAKR